MTGLNFGSLFKQDPIYDDEGKLQIITGQEEAGKYKSVTMYQTTQADNTNTVTLVTVPPGTTFFLVGYAITFTKNVAADVTLTLAYGGTSYLEWILPITPNQSATLVDSQFFTMPVPFAGVGTLSITCSNATNTNYTITIWGWTE